MFAQLFFLNGIFVFLDAVTTVGDPFGGDNGTLGNRGGTFALVSYTVVLIILHKVGFYKSQLCPLKQKTWKIKQSGKSPEYLVFKENQVIQ